MGVPGFFAWILRKYKHNKVICDVNNATMKINTLYIDANCLFHPQCFKVIELIPEWNKLDILENKMTERIIKYIEYLIEKVNPKNVMISVDGVAPAAKLSQQRKRRFRSLADLKLKNNIKRKHNKNISKEWSNIVITPGTEFMEKLHQ